MLVSVGGVAQSTGDSTHLGVGGGLRATPGGGEGAAWPRSSDPAGVLSALLTALERLCPHRYLPTSRW